MQNLSSLFKTNKQAGRGAYITLAKVTPTLLNAYNNFSSNLPPGELYNLRRTPN